MKIEIKDNCLPANVFKKMKDDLMNLDFPWYYSPTLVTGEQYSTDSPLPSYNNNPDAHNFTHVFYNVNVTPEWSIRTSIIRPILDFIAPKAWIRVRASLGPRAATHLVGGWHYDISDDSGKPYTNSTTALLYINTNNGYTLMENGDKVGSVANRFVLFPCNVKHTGINTTDTDVRAILSFNFFT